MTKNGNRRLRVLLAAGLLMHAQVWPASSQSLAKDTNVAARELSDDLTTLGDYETIDSALYLGAVVDAFVDCTSIKILVAADKAGDEMVYDIPTQGVSIQYTDIPFDAQKDTSNFKFACIGDVTCIRITSPGNKIIWSGMYVKRSTGVQFRADGPVYRRALFHFKVFNKLCRAQ